MEKDHGQENIQNEVGEEISTSIRKEVARDMMNQRWATPEWREKMSKRGSELWQDIEYRTNILSSIDRDKQKEVARRTMKKNWEDPEFRKKASEHSFESQRISARVSMTQNWRDPKWVEFMRQKKRKVSTDIIEIFSISGMLQKDIEQILGLSQSKVANVVFRMRKANKFWENRTRDEPAVTFLAGLILNGFIMKDEISVLDINPSLEAHRLKKNLHLADSLRIGALLQLCKIGDNVLLQGYQQMGKDINANWFNKILNHDACVIFDLCEAELDLETLSIDEMTDIVQSINSIRTVTWKKDRYHSSYLEDYNDV